MTRPPISHSIVFTYTDDLERGSRFFREVMELDFVVDQGACHIYRLTPLSYIGVCNLPDQAAGDRRHGTLDHRLSQMSDVALA